MHAAKYRPIAFYRIKKSPSGLINEPVGKTADIEYPIISPENIDNLWALFVHKSTFECLEFLEAITVKRHSTLHPILSQKLLFYSILALSNTVYVTCSIVISALTPHTQFYTHSFLTTP